MLPDVVDLFLARAGERPDAPAIVTSAASITYGALERRVRALAAVFAQQPSPKVLIALPQSIDAYAAMLASGLAGGFYTPLNMASPIEKMRRIASQLAPEIVVGAPDLTEKLALPDARMVDPAALDETRRLEGPGARHDLAYVLFTSGSTGEPKGVMIPRTALAHYASWLGTLGIGPGDRVAQHANVAFDLSVFDIYGALCHGAALHPLDVEGDRLMPARFVKRHAVTVWSSTPSAVSVMMRARQVTGANLASIRLFNFCGEPLLKEHLDALFAAVPGAAVQNTYGPTEATVSMTKLGLDVQSYADHCATSVALGDAVPGMEIVLAGGPSADEGEIVIVGPQLARGYWRDPQKTAGSFRAVSAQDPRTGYFTGDWAWRRGGDLFFRERVDFQVKVRGHRVELDEVAAAIRESGYPVACVFKRGEALAAIVEAQGAFDEAALRARLQAKLEPHAIPERIVAAAELALNENGKLDRGRAAALMEERIAGRNG